MDESNLPKNWLERISHVLSPEVQDKDQLVELLRDAQSRKLLDADALAMIEGVLQVSEMQARDIMIPRSQMITLSESQSLESILPIVIESAHSRFPVMADNPGDVIGIIHAKDLLQYQQHASDEFKIRDLLRPVVVIPESKRLDILLKEFRRNRNHMAIIVDEYGNLAGFITIEDVIEQIVGDIEDEFDVDEDVFIKQHQDGSYIVKALTPIEQFNETFATELNDDEADTIAGLLMHQLGHMPKRGESIQLAGWQFEVLRADKRRMYLLRLHALNKD